MDVDIEAIFETSPRLTEAQVAQLFAEMADEPYYKHVDAHRAAGEKGAGVPSQIHLSLDRPSNSRLLGYHDETHYFLYNALAERDVEVTRLDVEIRQAP